MRKRNEEGFALVYVAIVIVVLCTIATAIMSYTLRNLQAQEAMVRRMQDKYEAMGEIERVVAELESNNPLLSEEAYYTTDQSTAIDDGVNAFASHLSNYSIPRKLLIDHVTSDLTNHTVTFLVTSKCGTVQVSAQISISPIISTPVTEVLENPDEAEINPDAAKYKSWFNYSVSGAENSFFTVYEITSTGGDPA